MDRISDSGSDDLGSNPDGVTKKTQLITVAFFIFEYTNKNKKNGFRNHNNWHHFITNLHCAFFSNKQKESNKTKE